ncbi:MAG: YdcF family protein [Rhodospirillaceae bacterium]|nr:YdcF family protein [Rhodospirillaceae bacterium]
MAAVLALILIAYGSGFLLFAHRSAGLTADPGAVTDAIVVPTGGSERFDTALALLRGNLADRLFVTGVHPGVETADLLSQVGSDPAAVGGHTIEVGHAARDTAGNAAETADWAAANGVRSIRLVTSDYHMLRSLLEFHAAMPWATIVPHPVSAAAVHMDHWWAWPGTAELMFVEYNKFVLTWVRIQADWLWTGLAA